MPSLMKQHGFRKGVKTVHLDAVIDGEAHVDVRIKKDQASVAELGRDRLSVIVSSRKNGVPLYILPRDTLTVYVADAQVAMTVLAVYPLAVLCQRKGVMDKAIVLLTLA